MLPQTETVENIIAKLMKIQLEGSGPFSTPQAIFTLALEIQELKKQIEALTATKL